MNKNKWMVLDRFWIKIIASIFMVIDHIALLLLSNNLELQYVLRILGRISLPLFLLMSIEALYHSRNVIKYCLTLIILGFIFDLIVYFFDGKDFMGNMFTTIGMGILACYLIKKKNFYSLLAILPIGYVVVANIFNDYVYAEYGIYGLVLIFSFFISYEAVIYYEKKLSIKTSIDIKAIQDVYDRRMKNIACSLALVLVDVLFYAFLRIGIFEFLLPYNMALQTYSIIAIPFLILYNGRKGYSNVVIKYSFYAFYPLHIAIIYAIYTFGGF